MTTYPLGGLRKDRDQLAVNEFKKFLLYKISGGAEAVTMAEANRASDAVVQELKTASPASVTSALSSPFAQALTRLIAENTQPGPFQSMRADMTEVPLRTRVIVSTATLTASEVSEAAAKPVRRLSLTNLDTEVSQFVAMLAVSKEFIDMAPVLAQRVLADALAEAVGRAVDTYFLSKLNAINSGESDSEVEPSFANMLEDLEELLSVVRVGQRSRLYFILPPRELKALAAAAYANGVVTAKYHSGEILGVRLVSSDAQAQGTITLAGASAIVYGSDGIEVRTSDVAALELDDAPSGSASSPTAANLVSWLATNTRAILASHRVAVRVADTDGVASLTGVQWGVGDSSPAMS